MQDAELENSYIDHKVHSVHERALLNPTKAVSVYDKALSHLENLCVHANDFAT